MSGLPDVRIVIRRRCDACEGTGEVASEEWEDFRAWLDARRPSGHVPEDYFLDFQGLDAVPPMRRECGACEGGWQDSDMAADDLVQAVLELVPVSVIPRGELEAVADSVRRSITAAAQKSQGLADADEVGSWLRAVQEGASALREVTELLVRTAER